MQAKAVTRAPLGVYDDDSILKEPEVPWKMAWLGTGRNATGAGWCNCIVTSKKGATPGSFSVYYSSDNYKAHHAFIDAGYGTDIDDTDNGVLRWVYLTNDYVDPLDD